MSRLRLRRLVFLVPLGFLAASIATLGFGGGIADAYASRAWVRHVSARSATVSEARQAVRRSIAALDKAAPLPVAGDVTRTSLEIVRRMLPERPQEALELSAQLRQAIEGLRGSWRGWGLGVMLGTAQDLEAKARDAAASAAAKRNRR